MALPHAVGRRRLGWKITVVALAMAMIGVGFFAYRAGVHAARVVTVRTGLAWSSGVQASVTSQGWVYNIPLGASSNWYGGGTFHEGGAPSCLPPRTTKAVRLTFATVSYEQFGAVNRSVVWVRCG